jgi:hypothetical protein
MFIKEDYLLVAIEVGMFPFYRKIVDEARASSISPLLI